jgi:hypothetical protein
MAIVLVFSLAVLALDDTKSPAQLCKDWGWGGTPAYDACVSCTAQGGAGGTSDKAECICKTLQFFQPDYFDATYKNLGDCVKQVNAAKK